MTASLLTNVAKRLLEVKPDYKNQMVNEALKEIHSVLTEKLAKRQSVEDDLGDFSLVVLAAVSESDDMDDAVKARMMLEEIWLEEESE